MERNIILPRPSADNKLYSEVRQQGFTAYPEREANYRKFLEGRRRADLDYLPTMLDIENVSRCNYRCTMCQLSEWPGGRRAQDMSYTDFSRLLDDQPGLVEIKLQGIGEPLLGRELFEMIGYARKRHLWVRTTTNGSLLHLDENYKRLIDSDICEIQVSIDGSSEETYGVIRKGGRLAQVQENCVKLNAYAEQTGRRRTRMWVVVQKANRNELRELPPMAARLGFERMTLTLDLNDWGQDHWRKRNEQINVSQSVTAKQAEELIAIGEKHNVEVTFWFIDKKFSTSSPKDLCPWPFGRVYISSDMRVVPCCMMANPEVMDLGDAQSLRKVWQGEVMKAFRSKHLEGRLPEVCRSCYC